MKTIDTGVNREGWSRSKIVAGVTSVVVMGAVLSPVLQNWSDAPQDSFPLSYYPMFTKCRDEQIRIAHVIGMDREGNAYRIRYNVAGPGGMNQVRKQVRRKVEAGQADDVCRAADRRIRKSNSGPLAKIETAAVVRSTFDLDQFVRGHARPIAQSVEATRQVD